MSEFGRRNTAGSNTEGYRYIRDWAAIRGRRGNPDASLTNCADATRRMPKWVHKTVFNALRQREEAVR
jgi:hypothetical protein